MKYTDPLALHWSDQLKQSARKIIRWPVRYLILAIMLGLLIGSKFSLLLGIFLMSLAIVNFLVLLMFRLEFSLREISLKEVHNLGFEDLNSAKLPVFSVIVPLKHEGEVIFNTLQSIAEMNYPSDKMEVLIIVEENDAYTLSYLEKIDLPVEFKIFRIPNLKPYTKGRALLHGLEIAKGEIITVYDAESRPSSNQFITVLHAMEKHGKNFCYQSIIRISNKNTNILTNFFAAEYYDWYDKYLNYISKSSLPFGLGGNSFFVYRDVLKKCGAWDPYNVTEDAELSVRLVHNQIGMKLISSITEESCPESIKEWLQQRIRWNKGLLITQLTHLVGLRVQKGGFGMRGWYRFWLRMMAGTLLPYSTIFIFFFFLVDNPLKWYIDPNHLSIALFIFLVSSIMTSILADRSVFNKLKINYSPGSILTGTIMYMILYILAGFLSYFEYFISPLKWNKTEHRVNQPDMLRSKYITQ